MDRHSLADCLRKYMVGRVGFEPTRGTRPAGFTARCFQPLSHLPTNGKTVPLPRWCLEEALNLRPLAYQANALPLSYPGTTARKRNGAGDGNRTRINSLEGCSITIMLRPHSVRAHPGKSLERAKGFEPSTSTLARLRSTPELRPLAICRMRITRINNDFKEQNDWGDQRGSNPRHSAPQADALPLSYDRHSHPVFPSRNCKRHKKNWSKSWISQMKVGYVVKIRTVRF